DPATAQQVADGLDITRHGGGGQALNGGDGWIILTDGPMRGFKDGQLRWTYQNRWPGLHAGHSAPKQPEYPGQLLAPTRLLGWPVQPKAGEAGPLWAINSDKGVMYLFTVDGLFVATLGEYLNPAHGWRMARAERGMLI